jgi:V8-like Glu-specific endopeptidase
MAYPYSAIGKVFLSDALGDYVCSGAVINSDVGNVVLTAGHCATLYGIDIDSAVFVPAYQQGTAPLGEWGVESFLVPRPWERLNNEAYDVAFYLLSPDPTTGEQIESVTGGLGIAWNMTSIRHWHILGYPAARPFDGELQWTCTASQASLDTVGIKSTDPPAIGLGCDMRGGSSGGPWITGFGDTNVVNSLVAYGYRRYPKALFGPYFGDAVRDLFACANEGSC